jgi:hypothetical protein
MNSGPPVSLFSFRQAMTIWLGVAVLVALVLWLNNLASQGLFDALLGGFLSGHIFLAVGVSWNRLRVTFPVDRSWLDVITVFGAAWIGPIAWHYEYQRVSREISLNTVRHRTLDRTSRRFWPAVVICLIFAALWWWRAKIMGRL